jgi:hypothetical protein
MFVYWNFLLQKYEKQTKFNSLQQKQSWLEARIWLLTLNDTGSYTGQVGVWYRIIHCSGWGCMILYHTPPWPVYDPVSHPTLTSVWSCIILHPDQCMILYHTPPWPKYDPVSYPTLSSVWSCIIPQPDQCMILYHLEWAVIFLLPISFAFVVRS